MARTLSDTAAMAYSSLGHLTSTTTLNSLSGARRYEAATSDALGILRSKDGGGADAPPRNFDYSAAGRPTRAYDISYSDTTRYDAAGNDSTSWVVSSFRRVGLPTSGPTPITGPMTSCGPSTAKSHGRLARR